MFCLYTILLSFLNIYNTVFLCANRHCKGPCCACMLPTLGPGKLLVILLNSEQGAPLPLSIFLATHTELITLVFEGCKTNNPPPNLVHIASIITVTLYYNYLLLSVFSIGLEIEIKVRGMFLSFSVPLDAYHRVW